MIKKAKVSVKKIPAKHGLNLNDLNKEQLHQLLLDANIEIKNKEKQFAITQLQKMKDSGKLEELKIK